MLKKHFFFLNSKFYSNTLLCMMYNGLQGTEKVFDNMSDFNVLRYFQAAFYLFNYFCFL